MAVIRKPREPIPLPVNIKITENLIAESEKLIKEHAANLAQAQSGGQGVDENRLDVLENRLQHEQMRLETYKARLTNLKAVLAKHSPTSPGQPQG